MSIVLVAAILALLLTSIALSTVLWRTLQAERARSDARVAAVRASIEAGVPRVDTDPVPVAVEGLFEEAPPERRTRTPLVAAAAVGVFAVALATVVGLTTPAASRAGSSTQAAAPGAAPLELTSMRHERDDAALLVSGFVRNPRRGTTTNGLTAVVFTFDRQGGFLASGRAPVDFLSLEPGVETPFVVTIPDAGDVGRYRVSFRTDTGIVRHVDKRAGQAGLAAHLR